MTAARQLAIMHARRAQVPEDLFLRLVQQESGFNPRARSRVGAQGFTQIMPDTGRQPGYGVKPWDGSDEDNMRFGADYLKAMLNTFNNDPVRATAAYNWGAGNVQKWDGNPNRMPAETRDYIQKVAMAKGGGSPASAAGGGQARRRSVLDMFGRNGPVTLADEEPVENTGGTPSLLDPPKKKGAQFHGGLALQSLGAAIASTAQGESAAPQLGSIRDQYFAEQAAEEERLRKEQQRVALISMVGENSEFGQALANGADPAQVLQAYMQSQGFGHDVNMAEMSHGFNLERDEFGHGLNMERDEFGNQLDMRRDQFGHGLNRERDQWTHGMALERDTLGYDRQDRRDDNAHANALERDYVGNTYQQGNIRLQDELQTNRDTASSVRGVHERNEVGGMIRDSLVTAYRANGNDAAAKALEAMPGHAFTDAQMATQIRSILEGPDAKDPTAAIQNFNHWLSLPEDQRGTFEEFANSGGTKISIGEQEGEFQKGLGRELATDWGAMRTQAGLARESIANLDIVETALTSGIRTGALGESEASLRKFAGALGVGDADKVSAADLINQVNAQMALIIRNPDSGGGLPGATSERDLVFLRSIPPSLMDSEGGIRLKLDIMKRLQQRKIETFNMANEFMAQNGGNLTPEFYQRLAEHAEQNPLFSEEERASMFNQAGAPAPDADGWVTHNGVRVRVK